jgi:hypothetical protein
MISPLKQMTLPTILSGARGDPEVRATAAMPLVTDPAFVGSRPCSSWFWDATSSSPKRQRACCAASTGSFRPGQRDVRKLAIGDEPVITHRPRTISSPADKCARISGFTTSRKGCDQLPLFPQVAVYFFKYRQAQRHAIDSTLLTRAPRCIRLRLGTLCRSGLINLCERFSWDGKQPNAFEGIRRVFHATNCL